MICDEYCRAVDAADVYAVGDVARWFHPGHGEHVRVEHWTNAVEHGQVVAHNIVHPDDLRAYRPVEYVWSDQYDWKIQIVGRPARATGHRLDREPAGRTAAGRRPLHRRQRTPARCVTVNWPKALVTCRRLVSPGPPSTTRWPRSPPRRPGEWPVTDVAERRLIADACRVVAVRGLADGILGHISLRVDPESLLPLPWPARARARVHDGRRRPPNRPRRRPRGPR